MLTVQQSAQVTVASSMSTAQLCISKCSWTRCTHTHTQITHTVCLGSSHDCGYKMSQFWIGVTGTCHVLCEGVWWQLEKCSITQVDLPLPPLCLPDKSCPRYRSQSSSPKLPLQWMKSTFCWTILCDFCVFVSFIRPTDLIVEESVL